MLSTHLRCPKTQLYLTAIAALLFNAASSSQADEPQIVELTIMFRIPVESLETFPLPFGEDAIGIVLDGDQNPPGTVAFANDTTFGDFAGSYYPTDGRYIAKGGIVRTADVFVKFVKDVNLPAHGFVSLKRCEIDDFACDIASLSANGYEADPYFGDTVLVFVHGWFQL